MKLFNSHVHTDNSIDCHTKADDMCLAAIDKGLSGIAFCDHCHGGQFITYSTYDVLKASHRDAALMKEKYNGKLDVFAGAEFDEILWSKEYIDRLIQNEKFDVILASVHKVRGVSDSKYISRVDFGSYTDEQFDFYCKRYFEDVLETAEKCDYDVLSHLTLILRYACGKHNRRINLGDYSALIDKTLKVIITRGKALEINTSEVGNIGFMPDAEILKRYRNMGGRLVTIGTDAHITKNIDYAFDDAIKLLHECGFDGYYYYKERIAQKVYI